MCATENSIRLNSLGRLGSRARPDSPGHPGPTRGGRLAGEGRRGPKDQVHRRKDFRALPSTSHPGLVDRQPRRWGRASQGVLRPKLAVVAPSLPLGEAAPSLRPGEGRVGSPRLRAGSEWEGPIRGLRSEGLGAAASTRRRVWHHLGCLEIRCCRP